MKPAVAWGLVSSWSRHGDGFQVIAITSEKDGYRGQWYGRDEQGNPTHGRKSDLLHRFESEAVAKDAHKRAAEVRAKLKPERDRAQAEASRLDKEMTNAVMAAAKGLDLVAF